MMATQHPTPEQEQARQRFDLEQAMAALPPPSLPRVSPTPQGVAGRRLRGHLKTAMPDAALREFAREQLGACRLSGGYLDALRVTLGNQAHAEVHGYTLELNIRTDFTTERVMRNIIDQMKAAGITDPKRVGLGSGRTQVVQVFNPSPGAAPDLCTLLRWEEARTGHRVTVANIPESIAADEVPY